MLDKIKIDPYLQKQRIECETNPSKYPGFTVRNGILYYKDQLVLPKASKFIPILLLNSISQPPGAIRVTIARTSD